MVGIINWIRFHVFNILSFPFFLMYILCILLATNPRTTILYIQAYVRIVLKLGEQDVS